MMPETKIILFVGITWLITEFLKIIITSFEKKKLSLKTFFDYGGMPSAHSAFVASLCSSIFMIEGLSTSFILSAGLAIVVLRDLITIRGQIDHTTEVMIKILKKSKFFPDKNLKLLSHTPVEILVGLTIGIVLPVILFYLI